MKANADIKPGPRIVLLARNKALLCQRQEESSEFRLPEDFQRVSRERDQARLEAVQLRAKFDELNIEVRTLRERNEVVCSDLQAIRNCATWKVGRAILVPASAIKSALH
jgi:hypothetical protein